MAEKTQKRRSRYKGRPATGEGPRAPRASRGGPRRGRAPGGKGASAPSEGRSKTIPTSARGVAFEVIQRVFEQGAWIAPALHASSTRAGLSRRDTALATEIVYGTLRRFPALDEVYLRHVKLPKGRIDPYVRVVLRASTYQILYLSRVPSHAVVHEAVEHARAARGARVGGFVNAVLRKVAAAASDGLSEDAVEDALCIPAPVEKMLADSIGHERLQAWKGAHQVRTVGLSVPTADLDEVLAGLAEVEGATASRSRLADRGVVVYSAGDPRRLPGFAEGKFYVQGESSQWAASVLSVRPGDTVLDACAGHGGKTLAMLAALRGEGRLLAVDINEDKLLRIEEQAKRLGLDTKPLELRSIDWTVGTAGLEPGSFDRVLVDAPCSGLGTIHRRPEILLRVEPGEPKAQAEVQRAILRTVAPLARSGGTLVYAVCSPLREEGASVFFDVFAGHREGYDPGIELAGPVALDSDQALRVGPWHPETADIDAFQVFRITV